MELINEIFNGLVGIVMMGVCGYMLFEWVKCLIGKGDD